MKLVIFALLLASASPEIADRPAPKTVADLGPLLRQNDGEYLLRYLLSDGIGFDLHSAQIGLGVERTCALVKEPFEAALNDLRPRWTKMFRSVAAKFPYEAGNKGREAQLFLAVGLESLDLLEPKVAEIARSLQAEDMTVSPDDIDYEARRKEIETARAEGRAWCGLRPFAASSAAGQQESE